MTMMMVGVLKKTRVKMKMKFQIVKELLIWLGCCFQVWVLQELILILKFLHQSKNKTNYLIMLKRNQFLLLLLFQVLPHPILYLKLQCNLNNNLLLHHFHKPQLKIHLSHQLHLHHHILLKKVQQTMHLQLILILS